MAKKRKMKKGPKIILFLLIVIIVLGAGYIIYKTFNKNTDNPVIDTITAVINDKTIKK